MSNENGSLHLFCALPLLPLAKRWSVSHSLTLREGTGAAAKVGYAEAAALHSKDKGEPNPHSVQSGTIPGEQKSLATVDFNHIFLEEKTDVIKVSKSN